MEFRAWMYDVARDQTPSEQLLDELCEGSLRCGYNAICLQFEHRFEFKSVPWPAPYGSIKPEVIKRLQAKYKPRGFRIIPFINLLGHMEGFIRAEGGQFLGEATTTHQAQMCPSKAECVKFAKGLLTDILETFDDEWVHLGGDEAWQLGQCPLCAEREKKIGKVGIYAEHYGPLCQMIIDHGKRPCVWGDMLLHYPEAMKQMPPKTVIFDWHYNESPVETSKKFRDAGFDVVCCPTIHVFDANWTDLELTRDHIDWHIEAVPKVNALGVCVTSWEYHYLSIFRSFVPIIYAAGRRLNKGESWADGLLKEGGEGYAKAATILGIDIPNASGYLRPPSWGRIRRGLAMRLNPFYLWTEWRSELIAKDGLSDVGKTILRLCNDADGLLLDSKRFDHNRALKGMIQLHRSAVLWVRDIESARSDYVHGMLPSCAKKIRTAAKYLHDLRPFLEASAKDGGAEVDLERLDLLESVVERTAKKVDRLAKRQNHDRYLPAFEILIDGGFVPGDSSSWITGQRR